MDIFDLIWAILVWIVRICIIISILFTIMVFVFSIKEAQYLISVVCVVVIGVLIWGYRSYLSLKKEKA